MIEVSKRKRQAITFAKEAIMSVDDKAPFTRIWKDKKGNIVAKDVPILPSKSRFETKYRYYITTNKQTK